MSERLDVSIVPLAGGGRTATLRIRSRWRPLPAAVAAVGATTFVWWHGPGQTVAWALPMVVILGNAARSPRRRLVLTDPVLVDAALRAANALGRETAPGHWRIEGRAAGEVARELERLHSWWTPTLLQGHPDRRRALAEMAGPALAPYVEREREPDDVEVTNQRPGEGWPVLAEPWPVLPHD